MKQKPIYLDYNATTPIDLEVANEMGPFLKEYFGNPSSSHYFGKKTKEAIKKLRGSHPEKLSQDEIKRNLTMIIIDKDAAWALRVVKDYGLAGEKDEVTPDEALVKCREGLRKIKKAERAHCNQCNSCNHCKSPLA